jgi:hypothetical protein
MAIELREKNILRYFDKFAGTTVIDLRALPKPVPVQVKNKVVKEAKIQDIEIASGPA